MKIIIKGKRGEGKSYLAVILMKLLSKFPYDIKYTSQTKEQEKDKMDFANNGQGAAEVAKDFKLRELEIIDIDDNEERY